MQEGPSQRITLHCKGCNYLDTKYWKDYLDNDETDSGTSATCTYKTPNIHISSYWNSGNIVPDWCPFIKD